MTETKGKSRCVREKKWQQKLFAYRIKRNVKKKWWIVLAKTMGKAFVIWPSLMDNIDGVFPCLFFSISLDCGNFPSDLIKLNINARCIPLHSVIRTVPKIETSQAQNNLTNNDDDECFAFLLGAVKSTQYTPYKHKTLRTLSFSDTNKICAKMTDGHRIFLFSLCIHHTIHITHIAYTPKYCMSNFWQNFSWYVILWLASRM